MNDIKYTNLKEIVALRRQLEGSNPTAARFLDLIDELITSYDELSDRYNYLCKQVNLLSNENTILRTCMDNFKGINVQSHDESTDKI